MAVGDFLWCQPSEWQTLNATVSGGADTSYEDEWLCDGRPGRPVRATSGSITWTVANSAKSVSIVACCNHNIDAARTITVGGDISTTMTGPAAQANGINLNPWASVSPTSCTSITFAVSSNSTAVIVGEFVAGLKRTMERNLAVRPEFMPSHPVIRHDAEFDSLNPYDKSIVSRTLKGDVILTDTGLAAVRAWWESTRGGSRISLIVPDSNVQDAWLVYFTDFRWKPANANVHEVSLAFQEVPRSAW